MRGMCGKKASQVIRLSNGSTERMIEMEIKDSGERTRFDTGAVRDMHTGKGRMDLLPWEALVEVSKHCEKWR